MKNFLRFSPKGAQDGDLIFVSGHPGRTSRLLTVAELEHQRDQALPFRLNALKRLEVLLGNWAARSEQNWRRSHDDFLGVQNSRKALDGKLAGLLDPELFSGKVGAESDFKATLAGKPDVADALSAYEKIPEATRTLAAQAGRNGLLEGGQAFRSDSFGMARTLLRAGDERPKPNGERLREFADSGKESLELHLFSEKPIYADLEILLLTEALTSMAGQLGSDDSLVKQVLAGKPPRERAVELIQGTKVRDVAFRKQLYQGGASAVAAAKDPMIDLARLVDEEARALRRVSEAQGETKQQAHAAISRARNALLGTVGHPDGNLQSLPGDYAYSDKQNRATSVHSAAILEALTKVYGTKELARELVSGRR